MTNNDHKIVQLKMNNGYIINAIKDDFITNDIEKRGGYEETLCEFLKHYLSSINNPTCLDIGANIGAITLTMCKYS